MDTPIIVVQVMVQFLWLAASYLAGLALGVLLHELGHALAALLATRQKVVLQLGRGANPVKATLGRLTVSFSLRGLHFGFTRYDRSAESRTRQTVVALAGPVASSFAALVWAGLTINTPVGSWLWIAFLGLFVSNFRILIVALWPIAYRPDGPHGEVWLSDSLDVWKMWRR